LRQRCNRLLHDIRDGLDGLLGATTYFLTGSRPFLLAVALAYLVSRSVCGSCTEPEKPDQ